MTSNLLLPRVPYDAFELEQMRLVAGSAAALPERCTVYAPTLDAPPWDFTRAVAYAVPCRVTGPNSAMLALQESVGVTFATQVTFAVTRETLLLPQTQLMLVVQRRDNAPIVLYTEDYWTPPHDAIVFEVSGRNQPPGM